MAWRGRDTARAVRCGAAVAVLGAATLTVLVMSQWPAVVEQGSPLAGGTPKPPRLHQTAPAIDYDTRLRFVMTEPSFDGPVAVKLVAKGSAEEERRAQLERLEMVGPARFFDSNNDNERLDVRRNRPSLYEQGEWWRSSPTGQMVDEIVTSGPTRVVESIRLLPPLEPAPLVHPGAVYPNPGEQGQASNPDKDRADFASRLEPMRASREGVTLPDAESPLNTRLPTIGLDPRLDMTERSGIRAGAVSQPLGEPRDYVDLRLEQVWRLGGGSSVSLGLQHLHGLISNETPELMLRKDGILLELKIGF